MCSIDRSDLLQPTGEVRKLLQIEDGMHPPI